MAKCKTRQELAQEYGVSRSTFYRMLKQADICISNGLVNPKEQEKIYHELGRPVSQTNKRLLSNPVLISNFAANFFRLSNRSLVFGSF